MDRTEFISRLNTWGKDRTPFLFIVDFEFDEPIAFPLAKVADGVVFNIEGFTNETPVPVKPGMGIVEKQPITFEEYSGKFKIVYDHLNYGDSYLTNLTTRTKIALDQNLSDVYHTCSARYKLLYKNDFLVFSPESFVKIKDNKIYSFPMKGTIDAGIKNAGAIILSDKKELAEHVTIVDLIRNDLSQVSRNVTVTRFRYIDEIRTRTQNLLQVSSEICGTLPSDFYGEVGNILSALLPAGSVSGAPKSKTLEIIRKSEQGKRGYYTGVFGYFDGHELNSGVMIRFIEREGNTYYYRSGGGITTQSDALTEYQETISKVYVPVD